MDSYQVYTKKHSKVAHPSAGLYVFHYIEVAMFTTRTWPNSLDNGYQFMRPSTRLLLIITQCARG